jgi:apolipoprotein N-acyltransferase
MMAELLRWLMPAPLSFGWWRLGLFAHDIDWLIGSARVWGTWGLTWVFAAFCGWVADLLRLRRLSPQEALAFPHRRVHLLGLGPLALGFALCLLPAPATEPGPRVLVVQPGIEQAIKAFGTHPLQELYRDAVDLTHEGLQSMDEPPDLVAWGESMLPFSLPDEGVVQAQRLGMGTSEHAGWTLGADTLASHAAGVATFVEGVLLGRVDPLSAGRGLWAPALNQMAGAPWHADALRGVGVLPVGTSFLTGLITWVVDGDVIRKQNAAALWGSKGGPGLGAKVHLVPGAEQAAPYTSVPFVLDALRAVGGYVPDFVPAERAAVLSLEGRGGRTWSLSLSICYDNVFDDPYREPLEREQVDFFCILSNEAWYKRSVEMDHLVAMTRMKAVAVGRSILRATNSGISILVDPQGRTVAVLEDGEGQRKMVRGTLAVQIPVPQGAQEGWARTFWVRTGRFQPVFWILLVVLLLALGGGGVTAAPGGVRPSPG